MTVPIIIGMIVSKTIDLTQVMVYMLMFIPGLTLICLNLGTFNNLVLASFVHSLEEYLSSEKTHYFHKIVKTQFSL